MDAGRTSLRQASSPSGRPEWGAFGAASCRAPGGSSAPQWSGYKWPAHRWPRSGGTGHCPQTSETKALLKPTTIAGAEVFLFHYMVMTC